MKRSITTTVFALVSAGAFAQISFTGSYSEDFNTWPNEESPGVIEGFSLPWTDNVTKVGWYQGHQPGATIFGNEELLVGQAPGLTFLSSLGMPFETERAIGSGIGDEPTSNGGPIYWGFRLQNNSDQTISSLDFEFDVENWLLPRSVSPFNAEVNTTFGQYRVGGSNFRTQDFTNAPQLNLTSLAPIIGLSGGELNGNLAANRYHVSATLSSLNWQVGESLWIRWQDVDNLGRDAIFGIDNLNVATTPVPEPASILLLGVGSSWFVSRRRRTIK